MLKRSSFIILLIFLLSTQSLAVTRCIKYKNIVRRYTWYYFSLDYPWWFNIGQMIAETNCRDMISRDGINSVGIVQITWRWWKKELIREGIYSLKTVDQQIHAQTYILHKYYERTSKQCPQLYLMYQCYNRSCWKVLRENKHCSWLNGFYNCRKFYLERICVWKKHGRCIQYRTNCDINYHYSKHIYRYGLPYQEYYTSSYPFF